MQWSLWETDRLDRPVVNYVNHTSALPEAQRDRFLFHVKVDYPQREQEREIVTRTTSAFESRVQPVITETTCMTCSWNTTTPQVSSSASRRSGWM